MPKGWNLSADISDVSRVAQITIDKLSRTGKIELDRQIFEDPEVPEGCKIFMFFHEIGHLIHGANEGACDEFAFWHALRVGVTPFMCILGLTAYMPEHYQYRVERLAYLMKSNPQLKRYTDAN